EVSRAALDDLADESARGREERSAADAHLHAALHEAGDVGELDPLVPHAVIVSGAGAGGPKMWDAWWWTMRQRSPSRSNKLVVSTAVTAIRSWCSVRMCSVHVTHARSPWLEGRTSESVKRISAVCVEVVCEEARTMARPTRSGQPGCPHRTCSPWPRRSPSRAGRASRTPGRAGIGLRDLLYGHETIRVSPARASGSGS